MQKESLRKKEIPVDILELFGSKDTALTISEICLSNGVEGGEQIEKVAYQIARVLLGQLPPQLLGEELEEREGFSSVTAYNIVKEVNQRLFAQIEESLALLYEKKAEIPEKPPKKDIYREPVE